MSSIARILVAFFTFLVLTDSAPTEALAQGFLEGHLKIVWMSGGALSDEMPRSTVAPETYANYPLIVLSQEGKKEVVRVTADQSGNYRIALTPGAYIIDVQGRAAKRISASPQPFTIISNQTVHVDLSIFIGLFKGQASASSN
jgi:hypothetical protein